MEMEEFKNMFNTNIGQSTSVNDDIITMIYSDSNSPLAALEKKLKITLYIFPFVIILFSGRFLAKGAMQHISTAWLLYTMLSLEFFVSLLNYRIIQKLMNTEGPVKQNLAAKLNLLQNRYRLYFAIHNLMVLLMAVLLEVTMYYHWDSNFDGWSKVNVWMRITGYLIFFVVQYLIKHSSQKKHYGQYIEKLHQLADQIR